MQRKAALRAFAPAWIAGDAAARGLLPARFEQVAARTAAARAAASRRVAAPLVDALAAQHSELAPSSARQRHLDALAAGNAAAVVSGQQVGLFTGPALTLYKAAGVVAAARRLAAESGVACVPIFWLQTEDHDWPEIDHCIVHGAGGEPERITAGCRPDSARIPVAARRFDESIEQALAQLENALAAQPHAGEVLEVLRRHYRSGVSPAAAFRAVLAELLRDDGLLLFDPRCEAVTRLTQPIYERGLLEASSIAGALADRAAALAGAGFTVQVPVRPDAALCFFHPHGADGPRYRLEARGPVWRLCDSDEEIRADEALRLVREEPLRFSSSALLRPLVQDWLFPTAAYLAGPGEIAYFAELAPLYEALGVAMPVIAPRPSFCVTSGGDRRRLEILGASFDDIAGKRDDVLARFAPGDAVSADDLATSLTADFITKLEELAAGALALDATLARPIAKTREAVEHAAALFADRYRRSLLARDTVLAARVDRLRASLAPGGIAQERCYGFASLAARHGIAPLLDAIAKSIEPFDAATREIAL